MTEPAKDAIVAFLAVAAVSIAAACVAPSRAPIHTATLGQDETPEPLQTRRQRAALAAQSGERQAPAATRDRTGSASPLTRDGEGSAARERRG